MAANRTIVIGSDLDGSRSLRCLQLLRFEVNHPNGHPNPPLLLLLRPSSPPDPSGEHAKKKIVFSVGGRKVVAGRHLQNLEAWACLMAQGLTAGAEKQLEATVEVGVSLEGDSSVVMIGRRRKSPTSATNMATAVLALPAFGAVHLSVSDQMVGILSNAAAWIHERYLAPGASMASLTLKSNLSVELRRSTPERFRDGGYAEAHYVKEIPCIHDLCYELWSWATIPASDGGHVHADERGMVPIAFIAFGVYICGESTMPWLPRPPACDASRRFDVAQIDRLCVMPGWREQGVTSIFFTLAEAFLADGFPLRIKTASASAMAAFSRSPLLLKEGHRRASRCGTGKAAKGGWVFWLRAPVHVAHTGRRYRCALRTAEGEAAEDGAEASICAEWL